MTDQEAKAVEDVSPGRRTFLHLLLGAGVLGSLASFFYPILNYLIPPAAADLGSDEVVAAKAGDLKLNSGKIFRFGSRPGIIVRNAQGEYVAMSATCTHLSCIVQYQPETRRVWCACHNGVYDLNGRNVSGPPPRPLEAYDVHVRGDEVYVSRRKGA
jgi:Rieske Fe-S protein